MHYTIYLIKILLWQSYKVKKHKVFVNPHIYVICIKYIYII